MIERRAVGRTVAAVVALLAIVATTAPTAGAADPEQSDPPTVGSQRYLDEVFTEVEVTENVLYRQTEDHEGNPIDLRLDLYEPAGDTALERPLVIFMHGGWFAFGSKNGMGPVAATYVRRGFVVAAIDYRLNPDNGWNDFDTIGDAMTDDVFLDSVFDANVDAGAAVKWLRRRAPALRLDPEGIVAAGHSAGAVLALLLGYFPFSIQVPGSFHWEARVGAAMPWSGVIPTSFIQTGEPPLHVSHGTADGTIPYSFGKDLCDRATLVGNTCELFTLDGVGHGLTANKDEIVASEAPFLMTHVLAPLGITTDVAPTLVPTFPDVPASHLFFYDVECAAAVGAVRGFADGTYRPTATTTRQELAALHHRLAGSPPFVPPIVPTFSDVPATHLFATEIEWAAAQGLATGHADGTFRPTTTTTRQELAAFHHRQAGKPNVVLPIVPTFSDVPATHLFATEIEWAAAQGLVSGHPDGTYRPAGTTTRQATAGPACRSTLSGL
jgi:acetyl esterase/lipase